MIKKRTILLNDFTLESRKLRKEINTAFQRVITSGQYILGNEVSSFEKEFASYLGTKHCVAVANGLEALQISLLALGIGKGDEVITTPISAVATTLAILHVGATPIFVDTDEKGLIDITRIEEKITKHTKAILPVHLYGQSCDNDGIRALCKKYHLFFIEDACQAHGSLYKHKKLGTIGDIGCFSFYPTKNFAAYGDGGGLVTNDASLAKICREIRDYGQEKKYYHVRDGLNSRLDELQAAFLQVKLPYLDEWVNKRQESARKYLKAFANIPEITCIYDEPVENCNFHIFAIRVKKRDALQAYLAEHQISTTIHYPLIIPDQPFLKEAYGKVPLPKAKAFVADTLTLPIHPYLTHNEIDKVISVITQYYKK